MAGTMKRILDHLIYPPWRVRRAFPAKTLKAIEDAVAASESLHRGELRFVVEAGLSFSELWRGTTARQRARCLLRPARVGYGGQQRRADLRAARRPPGRDPSRPRHQPEGGRGDLAGNLPGHGNRLRDGRFHAGALAGVQAISQVLTTHFPAHGPNPDELPNAAIIL